MKRTIAFFLSILLATNALWTSLGCGGSNSAGNLVPDPSAGAQKGVIHYIDDHLGSAHLITDSKGTVLREESRYPYGLDWRVDGADATTADYVYTGKEYDAEIGLVYFGGRYYSPEMERWITPDAAFLENPSLAAKRPLENNIYSYVKGNPVKYMDPDGSIAWDVTIDIAMFAYSLYQFANEPSRDTGINLALDTAGLLPVVPALGAIRRVGSAGIDALKGARPYIEFADVERFGQYTAKWTSDQKARIIFQPMLDKANKFGVKVTGLDRGNFPRGSGGALLAGAIEESHLFFKPEFIEFNHVINERTLKELGEGISVENTLLGKTMRNTVESLGGELSSMKLLSEKTGSELRYHIVGDIKYRFIQ